MDSAGGQSGSPVWQYDGENRYILSILAYEYENGADANFGTRLNQNKFDDITSWLLADSLFPPDDLPDLLDRGFSSGISTSTVTSGKTVFSIYSDIKNHGTEDAASFNVSFYASEDLFITATDFLIGISSITNLAPFSSASTNWSGKFPRSIPVGDYFIGWIIDANNDIEEIDENNNIISDNRLQITVTSKKSPNLLIPILITIPIVLVGLVILIAIIIRRVHKRAEVPIDHDF